MTLLFIKIIIYVKHSLSANFLLKAINLKNFVSIQVVCNHTGANKVLLFRR